MAVRPKRVIAAGAAAAGALLAYAHLIEPRWLAIERWTVRIPDLPAAWEGMRIVHLTDFQIGMWLQSPSLTPRALRLAASLQPDLVFLTGDFLHHGRWRRQGAVFTALAQQAPVFAVLGNHDHAAEAADAAAIADGLRAQGVTVLMNSHAPFPWRGESWTIVGIDDFATEHADLLAAVKGIPPGTRLLALLTHVPDAAEHAPEGWFPLIVAGHTHGAQVRISPFKNAAWRRLVRGPLYSKYPRGWFEMAGGLLYVNRGLGLSALPLRFAVRPEVAVLTLTDGRALPEDVRWART